MMMTVVNPQVKSMAEFPTSAGALRDPIPVVSDPRSLFNCRAGALLRAELDDKSLSGPVDQEGRGDADLRQEAAGQDDAFAARPGRPALGCRGQFRHHVEPVASPGGQAVEAYVRADLGG
jgi:hypothetical protein